MRKNRSKIRNKFHKLSRYVNESTYARPTLKRIDLQAMLIPNLIFYQNI